MSDSPKPDNQGEEDQNKFSYLQGKYIFRFPFTLTTIKWATIMGGLFAAHTFIKKGSVKQAIQRGFSTWSLSLFPLWCFFMAKYSLYSYSIKKFQVQQLAQAEDSELRKRLMQITAQSDAETEDQLYKVLTNKITSQYHRNKELDFLLEGIDKEWYDSITKA